MPPKKLKMRAEKKKLEKVYANRLRQVMDEEFDSLVMEDFSDTSFMSVESEMEAESQHSRLVQNLSALLSSVMAASCRSCSCCANIAEILQRAKDSDPIYDKSACSTATLVSSTTEQNPRQLSKKTPESSKPKGAQNRTNTQNLDGINSESKPKNSGGKKRPLLDCEVSRVGEASRLSDPKSPLINTSDSQEETIENQTTLKTKKKKNISTNKSKSKSQPKASSKTATETSKRNNNISEPDDTVNQPDAASLSISNNTPPKARKRRKCLSVPKSKAVPAKVTASSPQVLNSESEITKTASKPKPKNPTGNKLSAKKKPNLAVGVEISQTSRSQSRTEKVDSVKKQSVKSAIVDKGKNATGKTRKGATGKTRNKRRISSSSSEDLVSEQSNNIVANIGNELYTISMNTESKTRKQIARKLARRAGSSLHDSILTESVHANSCAKRLYSDEAWRNSELFEIMCKPGE